jgi:hypothetical protein
MKETLYKLTDQNRETRGTKWGAGVTHRHKICDDPKLCSGDVFHAYRNVNLAFLLNPNHANIYNPILWECKGKVVVSDYGKVGCFSLLVTKRLPAPAWSISKNKNRVRAMFAILCAEAVLDVYETAYPQDDRPRKAIEAAKEYVKNPSAHAAADAADDAYAAARDAVAFAPYATALAAALAAELAAERATARAADDAARAAARAADDAARADIDFGALADKAVELLKEMETTK